MTSNHETVTVTLEFTPNPQTLKYVVNRELLSQGGVYFTDPKQAQGCSPLAEKLFQVPGVAAVMLGKNFITLTKTEQGDWDMVHQKALDRIQTHLNDQGVVFTGQEVTPLSEEGSVIEQQIRQILDEEIRPAVAMDGGDIVFESYQDGVVYVYLHGACRGCPGSTATLKMGVEARLREKIPEIQEVIAL